MSGSKKQRTIPLTPPHAGRPGEEGGGRRNIKEIKDAGVFENTR